MQPKEKTQHVECSNLEQLYEAMQEHSGTLHIQLSWSKLCPVGFEKIKQFIEYINEVTVIDVSLIARDEGEEKDE